ncbi:hypothetical protein IFM89_024413 [Coptis chinensis]|uniref:Uncharacterized protein n=1 Tax=Coptis chinensis TaxID=261450 RepID=A0A835IFD1_9MAGN|nr:hypothetical protein IFM89_024413 [Coptis chinensis]
MVIDEMDKIRRSFLWGHGTKEKRMAYQSNGKLAVAGFAIRAWKDHWIPDKPLELLMIDKPPGCLFDRVHEFIDHATRQWKVGLISNTWPEPYARELFLFLCRTILKKTHFTGGRKTQ